ncbi:MAG: PrgI family protein [Patescibacteria group bacterium]
MFRPYFIVLYMRFQVPQFIEVEDKIFGPLTFKQFVYIVGGAGVSFIIFRALPLFFALLLIAPIMGFSLALAFYKINDRPFVNILESAFNYLLKGKLYLWRKEERLEKEAREAAFRTEELGAVPKLTEGKLKDIAWSLDVQESIYAGEKREQKARALNTQSSDLKL